MALRAARMGGDAGLAEAYTAQLFNHLLLMNFGTPRLQWRRVIR